MKLLMTTDTIRGVWTYSMDLCQLLAEQQVEVALATWGEPLTENQRQQVRAVPSVRLYETTFKPEWMDDPWEDIRSSGRWLLQLRDRFRPDVVHLNAFMHGSLSWEVPVVIVAHSCMLGWWEAVRRTLWPSVLNHYRREVTQSLMAAHVVVAPSHAMLDGLRRFYGPLPHARVIYDGRDPLMFRTAAKESFIFCAGRLWDEAKNLRTLEQAARLTVWPVLVAGDGLAPGGPCAEVTHVRYIGKLSPQEIAMIYARAAIYVMPAKFEPFGLSILEAALSSCALVLGDLPSLREIWGNAALYVEPNDVASLAYTLNGLVEDRDYLRELSQRARQRALRYSPSRMADEYLRCYHDAMIASPVPAPDVGGWLQMR